jgi:hypothetical protein
MGYKYTDFIYPDSKNGLSCNPGDAITTILDKVKNTLGNFEYFFDVDGNFRFQEIRNFINEGSKYDNLKTSISTIDFWNNTDYSKSIFSFDDDRFLINASLTPKYE